MRASLRPRCASFAREDEKTKKNPPQGQATRPTRVANKKEPVMLYTLAVVLVILWLLGMVTSYTMSGFIHVLLVVALIMVLMRVITGRRIA